MPLLEPPFGRLNSCSVRGKGHGYNNDTSNRLGFAADYSAHRAYLHGDTEGGDVIGSPWLDRDYELNQPVSKTAGFFIMIWVLIQSFKYQLIGLILFFATCRFAYKKFKVR